MQRTPSRYESPRFVQSKVRRAYNEGFRQVEKGEGLVEVEIEKGEGHGHDLEPEYIVA